MKQIKTKKKAKKPTGATTPASANPLGCCLVKSPDLDPREYENMTKAECDNIAKTHPGTVTQWNPGSCA